MQCTDSQFTNKHLLKKFLNAQDYFQNLDENNNNISQVIIDVVNQMDIKFYNKNTFLFHHDKEEYFDWFIILKGKASFYNTKSQQEIAQEINLLKQRDMINSQIDKLQIQNPSLDQKDLLLKLSQKKSYVEYAMSQISSSKYDYIFQKYPLIYYKQHPQVLSFKFAGYASKIFKKFINSNIKLKY